MVTLETLKKSVGKKNSNSKIFAWLADLERAAGDLDTALNRIDGGLTLYSNDVAAMIVRAKILFQKEDFEGCVQQCDKILVKDPFNLAAQKIMGDAYDKLGNVAERNLCYRRYHDMDPLNNFWKDEYDVIPDAALSAAMGGLAEDAFNMPGGDDESLDFNLGESDGMFDKSAETAPADVAAPAEESAGGMGSVFEKSNDSFDLSLDDSPEESLGATADADVSLDEPAPAASPFGGFNLNEEDEAPAEDDPFAALAAMLPNGDASDDSAVEDLSASLESVMQSIESGEPANAEEFPVDENISGNDVNSALADMFGLDDDLEVEEAPAAPAQQVVLDEEAEANASSIFGKPAAEDKPMSVDNAFNSIFGEDELPEELPQNTAKPEPAVEEPAEEIASAASALDEDKPTTVDNAFNDIFGEDELPEEKPQPAAGEWSPEPAAETVEESAEPAAEEVEEDAFGGGLFEKSAEDKPTTVDNAFDSIFGEDELPEELPAEKSSAEAVFGSGLFEKSAGADIFEKSFAAASEALGLTEPAEEPAAEETLELPTDDFVLDDPAAETAEVATEETAAPAEESTVSAEESAISADDFLNSFGALNLDEDKPAEDLAVEDVAAPAAEPAAEWSVDAALAAELAPEEEKSEVADAFGSIFGDDDDLPEEKPAEELAAEEASSDPADTFGTLSFGDDKASEEMTATLDDVAAPAEEKSEVADAFGSIFGDDDDLPEEKPAEPVAEVETPAEPMIASPMDFVLDDEPAVAEPSAEETASEEAPAEEKLEVDSAFSSIFGDDDDLPVEDAAEPAAEPVDDRTLAEKVDSAESELEMPSAEAQPATEDLAQEMGGAFASMFGNDDDLDLPDSKASAVKDSESTGAAVEEIAATVGSDEAKSDLDKSFDSLFGGDDSLDFGSEKPAAAKAAPSELNSLETEVSGAFKGLFDMEDDSLEESMPSNKGVDFLMSGDSDDEVSASLINNPDAPLDRGAHELDDSLNTRTLAEIYFDQGLYGKALDIYADLAQKEPDNAEIAARLDEIEKIYRTKFGGNA
ncbi:MAG: hypothetical protein MJZ05_07970 [Fibrobacter sp.]|nr:hypothetical protein [Fibrobacter sp.]